MTRLRTGTRHNATEALAPTGALAPPRALQARSITTGQHMACRTPDVGEPAHALFANGTSIAHIEDLVRAG